MLTQATNNEIIERNSLLENMVGAKTEITLNPNFKVSGKSRKGLWEERKLETSIITSWEIMPPEQRFVR